MKKVKNCKICGAEIAKNAKHCPACGAKNRKPLKLIIILAIIVFIIVCIGKACTATDYNVSEKYTSMSNKEFKATCTESINYTDLCRNNNDYINTAVKFKGEVEQVVSDSSNVKEYLVAISYDKEFDMYTDNIYVLYKGDESILENDIITIYGEVNGTESYTSIVGENIKIPEVSALYIKLDK